MGSACVRGSRACWCDISGCPAEPFLGAVRRCCHGDADGIFVAAAWRPPTPLLLGLAAVLGVGLGYLHGRELAHGMRPGLFIDGAAISIAFVLFYCATVVSSLRPIWAQIGVRVVSSWVVAISTLVLGLALR